jgi:hypothetical protein
MIATTCQRGRSADVILSSADVRRVSAPEQQAETARRLLRERQKDSGGSPGGRRAPSGCRLPLARDGGAPSSSSSGSSTTSCCSSGRTADTDSTSSRPCRPSRSSARRVRAVRRLRPATLPRRRQRDRACTRCGNLRSHATGALSMLALKPSHGALGPNSLCPGSRQPQRAGCEISSTSCPAFLSFTSWTMSAWASMPTRRSSSTTGSRLTGR